MHVRKILGGCATAAIVALAAGCGSGSNIASKGIGGAAALVPSDAIAFVALDSDLSSGQWGAVDGLLQKFPAHDQLLASLRVSFEQHAKLSWTDDVKPALGSELDLVALPGKQPRLVGLTQGGDRAKLTALLRKLDPGIVSEQLDGWTVFSREQSAVDAVTQATTKLADNNTFRDAVAKLASGALVRAYANGTEARQLLESLGKQSPSATTPPFAWASADVVAAADGIRIHGYSRDGSTQGAPHRFQRTPATPYASSLVDEIPSGAIVVADFPVLPGQFQFSGGTSMSPALKKLLGDSPIFLAELDDLLGGETALYVRPGLPIPELTIVTQPNDTAVAVQALDDILKTLRSRAAAAPGGFNLGSLPVVHGAAGGQLVISTSPQGLADFRSAGPKLSADPTFASAVKAAGMPAETTGFLYVNLAASLPLLQLIAPALGLTLPAGAPDASSLRTWTAYGTRADDQAAFTAFLNVR